MRVHQGGTRMWCPTCREVTVCTGLNPAMVTGDSEQRWFNTKHMDVNWFRRGRACQKCGHEFVTAELNEEFVDELVELRGALGDIRHHVEGYIRESRRAASSLQQLSGSLDSLRALNLFAENTMRTSRKRLATTDAAYNTLKQVLKETASTQKLAFFQTRAGRTLALNLEPSVPHVFTEAVRDQMPGALRPCHVRRYKRKDAKYANLRAHMPGLSEDGSTDYWKLPRLGNLDRFIAAYDALGGL